MTIQEAKANLGQPFKLLFITSGLAARFDTIRYVENGIIYGDFIEAPAEDCRLKQEQPEHLKKLHEEERNRQPPAANRVESGMVDSTGDHTGVGAV